jgi:hypothetical protein
MSQRENFLKRWSKLKVASRAPSAGEAIEARAQRSLDNERAIETTTDDTADARTTGPLPQGPEGAAASREPFDLASLPPLDSIGAESNVAAFLRPEVPPELARAALRRAWTSDPAIRDFVGLVENGWDFNDPSAMAGFGTLSAEEVARLAATLIGSAPATPSAELQKQKKTVEAEKGPIPEIAESEIPAALPTGDACLGSVAPERQTADDAAQQDRTTGGGKSSA